MSSLSTHIQGAVATLTLERGEDHALDENTVQTLHTRFMELECDSRVRAVILTGRGWWFCAGFDPKLRNAGRENLTAFMMKFSALYRFLFLYPKPLVAAVNGPTVGAGCVLALACDHRLLSSEAKFGVTDIHRGTALTVAAVEMLRYWAGSRAADRLLLTGRLLDPHQALESGLADRVCPAAELLPAARALAGELAELPDPAYAVDKLHLRQGLMEAAARREAASISLFVNVWYSEEARGRLEKQA